MFSSGSSDRFGGGSGSGGGRRAGYSAARRGRGHGRRSSAQEAPRSPSPPFGPVLSTIRYSTLKADAIPSSDAKITRVEDVASYNWLRATEPTIVVPGKPPRWTPTATPTKLQQDDPKGTYYRDRDAAYFPSYPMEPAVRSIFEAQPDLNTREVNVFGCGSTLGNLLRFARKVDTDKPFRFLVEVVGETVFLIRRGNSPKEVIEGIYGYGHTFPEANSTWDADVWKSQTHQRIIRYDLGNISTMIRFEADGYLADKVPAMKASAGPAKQQVANEDSLVSALAGSMISAHEPKKSDTLKVTRGQGSVPQSAVFDLKTRSIIKKGKDTTMFDQLPRLWIRQIPSFILAYHESGLFRTNEVTVHDIKSDVERWESDNKEDVRKLIDLLKKITDVVKATPARKLEVRYRDGMGLELRAQVQGTTSVLPNDLATRWVGKGDGADPTEGVALGKHSVTGSADSKENSITERLTLGDDPGDALSDEEYDWNEKEDYTACSLEACNYCGHCSY